MSSSHADRSSTIRRMLTGAALAWLETCVLAIHSTWAGTAIVEPWPTAGADDDVAVAAAALSGWYAVGDAYYSAPTSTKSVEIFNIKKQSIDGITALQLNELLPWMTLLNGGPDGPCGMAWSDSGRSLYVLVYDDLAAPDGGPNDGIVRYDTVTKQVSLFARIDLHNSGANVPLLAASHFRGRLYVGAHPAKISVFEALAGQQSAGAPIAVIPLPSGSYVRGLSVDRGANVLFAATETTLYRIDLGVEPLVPEPVATYPGIRAIAFSDHYGNGAGLSILTDQNKVFYASSAQAHGQAPFEPVLYWTSAVAAYDLAATADGGLLIGLNEDVVVLRDSGDASLTYSAWMASEFAEQVKFAKGLISPDGEPPGWVIDADVDASLSRFHPASPDGAAWVVLLLLAAQHVTGDPDAQPLIRDILTRYAGLAVDGIKPIRSADGIYRHWYEPTTGAGKPGWDPEWALLSTMQIVLAASRAAARFPGDPQIGAAFAAIRGAIHNWTDYFEPGTGCMYLRAEAAGGPELGSQVCAWHEGALFAEQAAKYGRASATDLFADWLDRELWPSTVAAPDCGVLTGNAPAAIHPAFITLWSGTLQPATRSSSSWQDQMLALHCSSSAWNDDQAPAWLTIFSEGTSAESCVGPSGYHADNLLDHPCDVAHFPALEAIAAWAGGQPYEANPDAATVGAYNAYRHGARQSFLGVDGDHPTILYRRPNGPSWLPNSAGLPTVAYGALGLAELLKPGTIDAVIAIDYPDRADLNGNGTVDGADLGAHLGGWGGPGVGDLDDNGTVDGADLGLLLGSWG